MALQNSKNTDEEFWSHLAAQAQKGDKRAYNRLLQGLTPFIRNYLSPRLANADWVDDVTQNVLISVHKALKTYDPDRPFIPWLMSIIHFRRMDFLRKYYRRQRHNHTSLDHPEFIHSHVTDPAHAGEYKDIEAALETIPKKQRMIFRLIKIEGYKAREVAEQTGMSVSAVKVWAHRTMKKIRKKLK